MTTDKDSNIDQIKIPLSKQKMTLALFGALSFVALGFWFIIRPSTFDNSLMSKRIKIVIIGSLAVIFFGVIAILVLLKFRTNKPGFIIDSNGMTDNSGGISCGFIPWQIITNVSSIQVRRQSFILIFINNPEEFIQTKGNFFKKKILQLNYNNYGTPICVSTNSLRSNFEELYPLVISSLKKYRPTILN